MPQNETLSRTRLANASPFQKRYLVLLTLSYLLGIFLAVNCLNLRQLQTTAVWSYTLTYVFTAGLCCIGLPFLCPKPKRSGVRRCGILVFSILLFFLLGLYRTYQVTVLNDQPLKACAGQEITLTGAVDTPPAPSSSGKTAGFVLDVREAQPETGVTGGRVQLYLKREAAEGLRQGDLIRVTARLRLPEGPRFQSGFSQELYLAQRGCFLIGFSDSAETAGVPEGFSPAAALTSAGQLLRDSLLASADAVLPADSDSNALLKGILTGSKDTLSDAAFQNLSRSGLIHIAAVSGLHVAFLFMMMTFLFSFFRLPKWLIRWIAIPVLVLFASAASFTPSVCRAVIMMILFLLAQSLQRDPDSLTSLFAAGLLLLLWNPYLLFGASFLLSFSSTLAILLFGKPLNDRLQGLDRLWRRQKIQISDAPAKGPQKLRTWNPVSFLRQSVSVSIASMIGISYFAAYFFHIVSLSGLIANIWVIPCTMLVFLLGFVNWVLCLIAPAIARWSTGLLLRPLLWVILKSTEFFADSPLVLDVPSPPFSFFPIYLILCGFLWYCLQKPRRATAEID